MEVDGVKTSGESLKNCEKLRVLPFKRINKK